MPGISGAERVFLSFGMRRGGDTVYTIEVTNRNAPKLIWKVGNGDTGFDQLGQTWSTPVIAEVNVSGQRKPVAIFGGGYDDGQDNPGYREDTDRQRHLHGGSPHRRSGVERQPRAGRTWIWTR